MKRFVPIVVMAGFSLAIAAAALAARAMTVKDIMGKLNKGPNALTPALKRSLQKDNPDWADILEQSKEYATLCSELPKATPPKGEKDSWSKLSKEYAENAKALQEAAKKKDKDGALAVHAKISKLCSTCHMAHRE